MFRRSIENSNIPNVIVVINKKNDKIGLKANQEI